MMSLKHFVILGDGSIRYIIETCDYRLNVLFKHVFLGVIYSSCDIDEHTPNKENV